MSMVDGSGRNAEEGASLDLVWGIANIARFIRRTNRQTYEALVKGELPARQVNGRWVASQRKLRELFEGMADG